MHQGGTQEVEDSNLRGGLQQQQEVARHTRHEEIHTALFVFGTALPRARDSRPAMHQGDAQDSNIATSGVGCRQEQQVAGDTA